MKTIERVVIVAVIVLWAVIFVGYAQGQVDAPSAAVRTCGPKWMGGCYVYGHGKTNFETLKDPYFLWPTIADGVVTSFDAAVTSYGLSHSECGEGNADLGHHPSDARIAGYNALIFGVTTGFRFVAIKVVPKDSRLAWISRSFSIGTAVRSSVVHVRAGRTWFTNGCL